MNNITLILLISMSFGLIEFISSYFITKKAFKIMEKSKYKKDFERIVKIDIIFISFLYSVIRFKKVFIISCVIIAVSGLNIEGIM